MSSKDVKHFVYKESEQLKSFNKDRYNLTFSQVSSVEQCLLRVLTGGVSIENRNANYEFSVIDNYFYNPIKDVSDKTLMYLWHDMFSDEGFSKKKLNECFHRNRSNSGFYVNVLLEITNALQSKSQSRDTQAFLYIYRAFEHIAYSFPLMYLQNEVSYSKTYDTLKKYFSDGGNSELAFCKQFIEKLLDSSLLDSTINIEFERNTVENVKVLNLLKVSNKFVPSTYGTSIKYRDVWDLVVECRNRYFHHLSGMSNSISSEIMIDSDSFFRTINTIALQLFSTIYLYLLLNRM
ncbi:MULTISPECIES: hypothetical protein [unclassified Vibrio]|uniref:hypothetical protein n=1 Tax=unclassified Vibrio TaxID=2614977 RepID=UPI001482A1B2|nr:MULTISPECIES: hypothetical protein [unclassified Vibrio]MDQ2194797.1 hypothetical protein [Vibrio sp. A14(2019)]MDQ2196733.1 hypothetical protein [Vibrio sp. 2017_1457_11]NNN75424.1 hypothetical protein [Vibrio sp. B7]NNN92001.1 hypothetical protein [Vibrio sp. B8-1]NNO07301.1 hypothetical protein [Vibrio sp. B4-12]